MYKRILIATDGSELSRRAIGEGLKLAKIYNAAVVGVHVTPPFSVISADPVMLTETREQYEKHVATTAAQYLGVVEAAARDAGVPCTTVVRKGEYPYANIIETAEDTRCDAICMASHGRHGVSALLLGSETAKVLAHSKVPVLVCR